MLNLQSSNLDNRLIFILLGLNMTIAHFCRLNYKYILKHNCDKLFLNEYQKRYKSFIEAAVYLNNQLENLNVLVNYAYEFIQNKSFNNQTNFPKFSVFKLMTLTWNREVLNKINRVEFVERLGNVYDSFLTKDLSKFLGIGSEQYNLTMTTKEESYLNSNHKNIELDLDNMSVISMISNSTNFMSNAESLRGSGMTGISDCNSIMKFKNNKLEEELKILSTKTLIEQ